MFKILTRNQVAKQITDWLDNKITATQLSIWAGECSDQWESDELALENEDLLLNILYQLRFADWLDTVPEEYLPKEANCSLSKVEAKNLLTKLLN